MVVRHRGTCPIREGVVDQPGLLDQERGGGVARQERTRLERIVRRDRRLRGVAIEPHGLQQRRAQVQIGDQQGANLVVILLGQEVTLSPQKVRPQDRHLFFHAVKLPRRPKNALRISKEPPLRCDGIGLTRGPPGRGTEREPLYLLVRVCLGE